MSRISRIRHESTCCPTHGAIQQAKPVNFIHVSLKVCMYVCMCIYIYIYIYKSFFIYVRAASLQEKTAIRPSIVVFVQALDVTREDKEPTEAVARIFCINYRHLCLMGQELQRQVLVILAPMTGLTSSGSWQPCSSSPNSHQPFQQYQWFLVSTITTTVGLWSLS